MGGFDKVFGLALICAGVLIATYYSAWMLYNIVS